MSVQTASYIEAIEHLPKGAILRVPHVSWEEYDQLLAELGDDYHVRVSYACGWLEIMSPLPEHGKFAEVAQDIAREITRELGVKLEACGSMTIRSAWQSKGTEPDTCFYVQNAVRIIGKRSLDFNIDPPPDIVVEIDVTNASQSKFPIYAALGVPEIWRYDGSRHISITSLANSMLRHHTARLSLFCPVLYWRNSLSRAKLQGKMPLWMLPVSGCESIRR